MRVILNMALFVFFWVLFCLIGEVVLGLNYFSFIMAWGSIASLVSSKLSDCITGS